MRLCETSDNGMRTCLLAAAAAASTAAGASYLSAVARPLTPAPSTHICGEPRAFLLAGAGLRVLKLLRMVSSRSGPAGLCSAGVAAAASPPAAAAVSAGLQP